MFTFSIVVIDIGVLYFVHLLEGGSACFTNYWGGGRVSPLCPLPISMYVTYVKLFVVVPKCKTFACGYMPCVWNKCVHSEARSTLQCLFPLGHVPFTYSTSSICCCLQDTLFNRVMGMYLGIKHYPHISLTFYNCFYWAFISH